MASPSAVQPSAPVAAEPSLVDRFLVLRGAPRELWVIYAAKLLEIVAYGLMTGTVILWLSADLGFTDAGAGDVYAWWSTGISLVTLLVGSLTDTIGIKKSFILGFLICVVTRAVMAGTSEPWIALTFGLFPGAAGIALMVPVMTAAVKAYSSPAQRSMAFSIYYALMNVGFAISGWVFDAVRRSMGEYGTAHVLGLEMSTYRVLFLVAFVATVPGLIITWLLIREKGEAAPQGSVLGTVTETARKTVRTFAGVWKEKTFYRFLGFLALVVGVRLVFYHMHATFPKFAIRELGEGAPIGQLWGVLNPVLIVLLVPLVGALTGRISSYTMVLVGTAICTLAVGFLVIDPSHYQGLADGWLGDLIAHRWLGVAGPVNPWYVSIALFAVLTSVGEAFWSPRLYEYTAAIAPKGQEASYMALSLLPYFVAKFGVGMLSGRLLAAFVPETGARDPSMLWLMVAAMAAVCPVGLLVFQRQLRVKEEGR